MQLSDFDYDLPPALIAQEPLAQRDHSRLLVLNRHNGALADHHFFELPQLLQPNDVLVLNNSKVIPARLTFSFRKRSCEIFYLREVSAHPLSWEVLVRPGKFFQKGDQCTIAPGLSLTVCSIDSDGARIVAITDNLQRSTFDLLEAYGSTPLPPYIHGTAPQERYQTIYAQEKGSLAAPTAGLHFTATLLAAIQARGIAIEYVTLHVGAGTFLPVKTDLIEDHHMHAEWFSLEKSVAARLNQYKKEKRRIIAVGTTSCRVLESSTKNGVVQSGTGMTDLFITPGYKWQFVDHLITNFHLPKSTLLLLVASFAGIDFLFDAYRYAIAQKYRFYSFGDAMWIA